MKKVLFWVTILSGATAAYLMFKRGVPVGEIANETLAHPITTLAHELKATS